MTELVVVFDPAQEMAAIVNVDEQCAWGPAMIGPNAGDILRAFLDTVPFDVTVMSAMTAQEAFSSFLLQAGLLADAAATEGDNSPVVEQGDASLDYGAARAEAEAVNATSTPPPQPADTDMDVNASPTHQMIKCPNCEGKGMIEFGGGEPPQQCGMCSGKGTLVVAMT